MDSHVVSATVGFAVFVFLTLVLLGAEASLKTREQSSLLRGRREIAKRVGLGAVERLGQSRPVMTVQVWILRLAVAGAFGFGCWHAANALF